MVANDDQVHLQHEYWLIVSLTLISKTSMKQLMCILEFYSFINDLSDFYVESDVH